MPSSSSTTTSPEESPQRQRLDMDMPTSSNSAGSSSSTSSSTSSTNSSSTTSSTCTSNRSISSLSLSSTAAAAAAAATSTTRWEQQQQQQQQRQCDKCVLLLQQVLEQSESKPAQLLRSMSHSTTSSLSSTTGTSSNMISWRKTSNGIQVEIPVVSTETGASPALSAAAAVPAASRIIEADPPGSNSNSISNSNNESAMEAGSRLFRRVTSSARQWSSSTSIPVERNEAAHRLAATSTRTTTTRDANDTHNDSDPPPKTEWLSLQCRPCLNRGAESNARAFVMGPTPLSVVVCSNRLQPQASPAEMAEIITHELVHIFDVRTLHLNLLHCPTLAYSEIRAAREAECHTATTASSSAASSSPSSSSWLHPFATSQHSLEHCVRKKATVATRNLFPERAQHCMDSVFDQAFADRRPFGNSNNNNNNNNSDNKITASKSSSKTPSQSKSQR